MSSIEQFYLRQVHFQTFTNYVSPDAYGISSKFIKQITFPLKAFAASWNVGRNFSESFAVAKSNN